MTWAEANHIDAPGLAAWLIEQGELKRERANPSFARRIRAWQRQQRVSIWSADKVLVGYGYVLSELPEELFVS